MNREFEIEILNRNYGRVINGLYNLSKKCNFKYEASEPYVKEYTLDGVQMLTEFRKFKFSITSDYEYVCKLKRIHTPKNAEFDVKIEDNYSSKDLSDLINGLTDLRCSHCNKKLDTAYVVEKDGEYILLGKNCSEDFIGTSIIDLMWRASIYKIVRDTDMFFSNKNIKPKKAYKSIDVVNAVLNSGDFVPKGYENSTYLKVKNALEGTVPENPDGNELYNDIQSTTVNHPAVLALKHEYINEDDLGWACVIGSKNLREDITKDIHPELDPFYKSEFVGTVGESYEFVPKSVVYLGQFRTHNAFSYNDDIVYIYEINDNGNRIKMFTTSQKEFEDFVGKKCTCKVKRHDTERNETVIKNFRVLK